MWFDLCRYVFFFLYPALSVASMSVFNCNGDIGYLKDDYTMPCPNLLSAHAWYSLAFVSTFPLVQT